MTNQPRWNCVANLGDADPFEYGGQFLMVDSTGVYSPELWVYDESERTRHTIVLDKCFRINNDNGEILVGANIYHHYLPEWFGYHKTLEFVASFIGETTEQFAIMLCGGIYDRARAYKAIADYYGIANFEHHPYTYETKRQARAFCSKMLRQIEKNREAVK